MTEYSVSMEAFEEDLRDSHPYLEEYELQDILDKFANSELNYEYEDQNTGDRYE